MCTAAEFDREIVRRAHDADNVAVFFSEERHSAQLLGFFDGHLHIDDFHSAEYFCIDDRFHLYKLLRCQRREVCEVESHSVAVDKLTCLLDMGSKHLAQSRLKQVRRRVIAACRHSGFIVVSNLNGIADAELSFFHLAGVQEHAGIVLGSIFNNHINPFAGNGSDIADLTAAFGIAYCAVKYHNGFFPFGCAVSQFSARNNSNDLRFTFALGVAEEFGCFHILEEVGVALPRFGSGVNACHLGL